MSPKAYSYVRFSNPDQRMGDSLRRQTEFSEQYAAEHGLVLDDSLRLQDLGLSAYSGEHIGKKGALGQFLKLVKEGKIAKGSVLIVESLDRLSRDEITEALEQFLALIRNGIKIVTVADKREYTKEQVNANVGDLMMSLTIMARAHEESATKAMRLSKAWDGKRKQISVKKLSARCPAWLELNDDRTEFTFIEDRKKSIQLIFSMKLAGKGATAIVRTLNRRAGWKPGNNDSRKQGDGWRESYVKKILQNRAVIGEFQPHRLLNGKRQPVGDPSPDYFPAVVDKNVFYRVQEQFRQNKHKGGQIGTVGNLFTHIVKCAYCGGSMAFVDKGPAPKGGQYLVCDRARRGLDCCKVSIKYDDVERFVLTFCRGLQPTDILNENNDSARAFLQGELDGVVGERNTILKEIDNLADTIAKQADGRVRDTLAKKMDERDEREGFLKQKEDQLRQQVKSLSRSSEDTQLMMDSLKKLMDYLSNTKGDRLIETRLKLRNELKKLIREIFIVTAYHPPYTIDDLEKDLELEKLYHPETYTWTEKLLRSRLENPTECRNISIHYVPDNRLDEIPLAKRKRKFLF